jgi:hypothetical protein
MAVYTHCYLVKGITFAADVFSLVLLRGNPRSGYPGSNDDDALTSFYLLRSSFLEQRRLLEAIGGGVFINRIADDESQRHGAAGPR